MGKHIAWGIGSSNFAKIAAEQPIFLVHFFTAVAKFCAICLLKSAIKSNFNDFSSILYWNRKMRFYQFLDIKGGMYLCFGTIHCLRHIFLKFCEICRWATNFFGSLFQSSCSVLCNLFVNFSYKIQFLWFFFYFVLKSQNEILPISRHQRWNVFLFWDNTLLEAHFSQILRKWPLSNQFFWFTFSK